MKYQYQEEDCASNLIIETFGYQIGPFKSSSLFIFGCSFVDSSSDCTSIFLVSLLLFLNEGACVCSFAYEMICLEHGDLWPAQPILQWQSCRVCFVSKSSISNQPSHPLWIPDRSIISFCFLFTSLSDFSSISIYNNFNLGGKTGANFPKVDAGQLGWQLKI